MFRKAYETTIKFHRACRDKDLETVYNLLRNDKEKIDVLKLDEMSTLLDKVRFFRISLEKLQEAKEEDPNVEVIKVLCEIGVDLHKKDSNGRTALHMVCCGTRGFSVVKCQANQRVIELLLENGASVHAKGIRGDMPLHEACRSGNLEVVQTLIHHQADVHATDVFFLTPLHKACIGGHLEIVQELLKCEANINAVSKRIEMTPLMTAALNGHFEIVEELLKRGADTNICDPEHGSALHLGVENEQIVKTLLKNGCNTTVRAKVTWENVPLPECTPFELALDMKSNNIVKMIAYHEACL